MDSRYVLIGSSSNAVESIRLAGSPVFEVWFGGVTAAWHVKRRVSKGECLGHFAAW
jgi:hypothetical protein